MTDDINNGSRPTPDPHQDPRPARRQAPRKARAKKPSYMKWVIGLGIIGMAVLIITQLNFGDGMVYFYTPKEVLAKKAEVQGKPVMVGAMVKAGTVRWQPEHLKLDFILTDFKGHEITVNHVGVKPDLFKENQGVVVEGSFAVDGTLKAKKLIVKHSEEYKVPHKGDSIDKKLLQESIFKNQAAN